MSAKYAPWYHSTPATPECRMPETGTGRGIPITEFERDSGDNLTSLSKQFGRINMSQLLCMPLDCPTQRYHKGLCIVACLTIGSDRDIIQSNNDNPDMLCNIPCTPLTSLHRSWYNFCYSSCIVLVWKYVFRVMFIFGSADAYSGMLLIHTYKLPGCLC